MSRIFGNISKFFSKRSHSSQIDENICEANFSFLTPELIERIFTHLDDFSLKSCLYVSKTFRDVIIYSSKLMDKLEFKFNNNNWQIYAPFIVKYGQQIRSVKFIIYNEFSMFLKILMFMPNVKKLSIQVESKKNLNTDKLQNSTVIKQFTRLFDCDREKMFKKFNLEKLENLEIIFSEYDTTEIIEDLLCCKNIRKFYFSSRLSEFYYNFLSLLLSQQTNLEYLELEVLDLNWIFAINKMNFRLKSFAFTTYYHFVFGYEEINVFLSTQSDCLEELKMCPWEYETKIFDETSKLKNLKKLTTNGRWLRFEENEKLPREPDFMQNLSYLKLTAELTNEDFDQMNFSSLPNLQCLSVRLVKNVKVTANTLRNLMNLKEFHIDSHDQGLLQFLASPCLEILVIPFDDILYDIKTWQQTAENLPNLQHLTIVNIEQDQFFTFLIENHEKILTTMPKFLNNDKIKIIELHSEIYDVLKLFIKNEEAKKAKGYFCNTNTILRSKQKIIKQNFKEFTLTRITEEEYFDKHDFWDSFKVKIPIENRNPCEG